MAKDSEKKSGGGGAVAGIAVLALLLGGGGVGLGYGTGFFGKNNNNTTDSGQEENVPAAEIIEETTAENEFSDTVTDEIQEESSDATELEIINITVSGSIILKDENEISADDLISEVNSTDGNILVNITDDSAIADTMDGLREKLDSANIIYQIR